jgi:hypothetical protein
MSRGNDRSGFCGGRLVFPPGARKNSSVYRGPDREIGPKTDFELYQCPQTLKKLRAPPRFFHWPPQNSARTERFKEPKTDRSRDNALMIQENTY